MTVEPDADPRVSRQAKSVKAIKRSTAAAADVSPLDFETFRRLDPLEQGRLIRDGIDARTVERVARELLGVPVQTLLVSLRLPSSTILRKTANGDRLSGSESDRLARVIFTFELAMELFDDAALAAEWMQRENALLGGLRPLEVLDTQPGYDRVRDMLIRITFGIAI
ncbi:MAG: hypothetical protein GAK40_00735 [Burkholderia plantarii]|nr:MAG: hypothetical protein GAK40_00735 [Burkholderia plantarii]